MTEITVVFLFDHFYPDYSSGGPVTSLANLHRLISQQIAVRIITSSREYGSGNDISGIEINKWTSWKSVSVWYATDRKNIKKALDTLAGDTVIYLNGVFSLVYFVYPLWLSSSVTLKVIISPRGMLQSGAMKKGYLKKKIFLSFLKNLGLLRNIIWHATDEQEAKDINRHFGNYNKIEIIHNVPRIVEKNTPSLVKETGKLKLVYFSLISEKKNLLFILELLSSIQFKNVQLDIIGPIKDEEYWQRCLNLIDNSPNRDNVKYNGEIDPMEIELIVSNYHALVLPTLGENFGHAIVEMLACSRPVLISDKTPWSDVALVGAGFALPLKEDLWSSALQIMLNWTQSEFNDASLASFRFYQLKFNFDELKMRYLHLFTSK